MSWLWYLIIGAIAGWLAGQIVKGKGSGLLMNIIIGIVGSMLGGVVFTAVGLSANGKIGGLIAATVGAVLLLLIVRWFSSKREKKE